MGFISPVYFSHLNDVEDFHGIARKAGISIHQVLQTLEIIECSSGPLPGCPAQSRPHRGSLSRWRSRHGIFTKASTANRGNICFLSNVKMNRENSENHVCKMDLNLVSILEQLGLFSYTFLCHGLYSFIEESSI